MGRGKIRNENEGQASDFQTISEVKTKYYPRLHPFEVFVCTLLWGGGVVITICTLIPISAANEKRFLKAELLEDGWKSWLGRYQDNSDYEWSIWKKYALEGYVQGFIGHFIVARFAERLYPERRFEILLGYSAAFSTYFLHVKGMLFLLFHVVVQYAAVRLTKSVVMCWITGLLLLYSLHSSHNIVESFYSDDIDKTSVLLICVGMSNLRYIGFSLEYAWLHKDKQESMQSSDTITKRGKKRHAPQKTATMPRQDFRYKLGFMDLLIYQMYLPLLYGGPAMNYDEFAAQSKRSPLPWTLERAFKFFAKLFKYALVHLFVEFALHYVHASALVYDKWSWRGLKIYHLCGLSMAQVGLFYLKYVIMYGAPSHFSSSDGLEVPGQPQCVYSKHRMTDFWKLVDKGLHKWLVRYIYIPCGGSRNGAFKAVMSLTISFAFVIVWHRPTPTHIRWGILSWFGVLIEYVALEFYRTAAVQYLEKKYFTPQWSRRFRAFLSSFAFGFLIVSNLYFLAGIQMGDVYVRRFYTENILATILIHVSLYGGAQSSMNLE